MDTLNIAVETPAESKARMKAALRGNERGAYYAFGSHADLLRTLTPNRWSLIEGLAGAGPLGVRELARRIGRDVKAVHTDAQALVLCGLLDKTEDGKYLFPYENVKVQFELHAAA